MRGSVAFELARRASKRMRPAGGYLPPSAHRFFCSSGLPVFAAGKRRPRHLPVPPEIVQALPRGPIRIRHPFFNHQKFRIKRRTFRGSFFEQFVLLLRLKPAKRTAVLLLCSRVKRSERVQ